MTNHIPCQSYHTIIHSINTNINHFCILMMRKVWDEMHRELIYHQAPKAPIALSIAITPRVHFSTVLMCYSFWFLYRNLCEWNVQTISFRNFSRTLRTNHFKYQCGAFQFLQEVFCGRYIRIFCGHIIQTISRTSMGLSRFFAHIMYKTTSVGLTKFFRKLSHMRCICKYRISFWYWCWTLP